MGNQLAVLKTEMVDSVQEKIRDYQDKGLLTFPANYNPANALNAAWLAIQDVKDRDNNPALTVCDKNSVAQSIFRMAVLGLNPAKTQCYFVVYGKALTLQPSYFGYMHLAKTLDNTVDYITADVVYDGDEFQYGKVKGRTVVNKHSKDLSRVNKHKIRAAYCSIFRKDGSEDTTIMTMEEIKQAWKQSKMNPVDDKGNIKETSTHGKFTSDMAKKTAISKACKAIANTSDDSGLLVQMLKDLDAENSELEAADIIAENANTENFDIDESTGEVTDFIDTTADTDDTDDDMLP